MTSSENPIEMPSTPAPESTVVTAVTANAATQDAAASAQDAAPVGMVDATAVSVIAAAAEENDAGAVAPAGTVAAVPTAKIRSALLRYRALAWFTGLWLLLLTGEMIAQHGFGVHTPSWIAVVHGWVYFAYLLVTADLAVKVRWPVLRTVGTLLAGTVPLLSFFVEHVNAKQVKQDFGV